MPDTATPVPLRLPAIGPLLLAQVRYQARLLLANGRAVMIGIGLPVLLLSAPRATARRACPSWPAAPSSG